MAEVRQRFGDVSYDADVVWIKLGGLTQYAATSPAALLPVEQPDLGEAELGRMQQQALVLFRRTRIVTVAVVIIVALHLDHLRIVRRESHCSLELMVALALAIFALRVWSSS